MLLVNVATNGVEEAAVSPFTVTVIGLYVDPTGTTTFSCVGVDEITSARMAPKKTMFSEGVALKLAPEIITSLPISPLDGVKELMRGAWPRRDNALVRSKTKGSSRFFITTWVCEGKTSPSWRGLPGTWLPRCPGGQLKASLKLTEIPVEGVTQIFQLLTTFVRCLVSANNFTGCMLASDHFAPAFSSIATIGLKSLLRACFKGVTPSLSAILTLHPALTNS